MISSSCNFPVFIERMCSLVNAIRTDNDIEVLEGIINMSVEEINEPLNDGKTLLAHSVSSPRSMKVLLSHNADPNVPCIIGKTESNFLLFEINNF